MAERKRSRLRICELNPHLLCALCGGYLIDATTIVECLHSFCKTCILRYLETSNYCPICEVLIHKKRPWQNIRLDHTLQNAVYKLVPGLFKREMQRRRDFYDKHPPPGGADGEQVHAAPERIIFSEDEKFSVSLEFSPNGRAVQVENDKAVKTPHHDKRFLLCPANVCIGHLKKFVRLKYTLPDCYQIDLFYSDEPLEDSYTLMDVAYIYSWRRENVLTLYYSFYQKPGKRRRLTASATATSQDCDHNDGETKAGSASELSSSSSSASSLSTSISSSAAPLKTTTTVTIVEATESGIKESGEATQATLFLTQPVATTVSTTTAADAARVKGSAVTATGAGDRGVRPPTCVTHEGQMSSSSKVVPPSNPTSAPQLAPLMSVAPPVPPSAVSPSNPPSVPHMPPLVPPSAVPPSNLSSALPSSPPMLMPPLVPPSGVSPSNPPSVPPSNPPSVPPSAPPMPVPPCSHTATASSHRTAKQSSSCVLGTRRGRQSTSAITTTAGALGCASASTDYDYDEDDERPLIIIKERAAATSSVSSAASLCGKKVTESGSGVTRTNRPRSLTTTTTTNTSRPPTSATSVLRAGYVRPRHGVTAPTISSHASTSLLDLEPLSSVVALKTTYNTSSSSKTKVNHHENSSNNNNNYLHRVDSVADSCTVEICPRIADDSHRKDLVEASSRETVFNSSSSNSSFPSPMAFTSSDSFHDTSADFTGTPALPVLIPIAVSSANVLKSVSRGTITVSTNTAAAVVSSKSVAVNTSPDPRAVNTGAINAANILNSDRTDCGISAAVATTTGAAKTAEAVSVLTSFQTQSGLPDPVPREMSLTNSFEMLLSKSSEMSLANSYETSLANSSQTGSAVLEQKQLQKGAGPSRVQQPVTGHLLQTPVLVSPNALKSRTEKATLRRGGTATTNSNSCDAKLVVSRRKMRDSTATTTAKKPKTKAGGTGRKGEDQSAGQTQPRALMASKSQSVPRETQATMASQNQYVPSQPQATMAYPSQSVPSQPQATMASQNHSVPSQPQATMTSQSQPVPSQPHATMASQSQSVPSQPQALMASQRQSVKAPSSDIEKTNIAILDIERPSTGPQAAVQLMQSAAVLTVVASSSSQTVKNVSSAMQSATVLTVVTSSSSQTMLTVSSPVQSLKNTERGQILKLASTDKSKPLNEGVYSVDQQPGENGNTKKSVSQRPISIRYLEEIRSKLKLKNLPPPNKTSKNSADVQAHITDVKTMQSSHKENPPDKSVISELKTLQARGDVALPSAVQYSPLSTHLQCPSSVSRPTVCSEDKSAAIISTRSASIPGSRLHAEQPPQNDTELISGVLVDAAHNKTVNNKVTGNGARANAVPEATDTVGARDVLCDDILSAKNDPELTGQNEASQPLQPIEDISLLKDETRYTSPQFCGNSSGTAESSKTRHLQTPFSLAQSAQTSDYESPDVASKSHTSAASREAKYNESAVSREVSESIDLQMPFPSLAPPAEKPSQVSPRASLPSPDASVPSRMDPSLGIFERIYSVTSNCSASGGIKSIFKTTAIVPAASNRRYSDVSGTASTLGNKPVSTSGKERHHSSSDVKKSSASLSKNTVHDDPATSPQNHPHHCSDLESKSISSKSSYHITKSSTPKVVSSKASSPMRASSRSTSPKVSEGGANSKPSTSVKPGRPQGLAIASTTPRPASDRARHNSAGNSSSIKKNSGVRIGTNERDLSPTTKSVFLGSAVVVEPSACPRERDNGRKVGQEEISLSSSSSSSNDLSSGSISTASHKSSHSLITGELRVKLPKFDIPDDFIIVTSSSEERNDQSSGSNINNAGTNRRKRPQLALLKVNLDKSAPVKVALRKSVPGKRRDMRKKTATRPVSVSTDHNAKIKIVRRPTSNTLKVFTDRAGREDAMKTRRTGTSGNRHDQNRLKLIAGIKQPRVRIVDIGSDHRRGLINPDSNKIKAGTRSVSQHDAKVSSTATMHNKAVSISDKKTLKVVSGGDQNKVKIVIIPNKSDQHVKTNIFKTAIKQNRSLHIESFPKIDYKNESQTTNDEQRMKNNLNRAYKTSAVSYSHALEGSIEDKSEEKTRKPAVKPPVITADFQSVRSVEILKEDNSSKGSKVDSESSAADNSNVSSSSNSNVVINSISFGKDVSTAPISSCAVAEAPSPEVSSHFSDASDVDRNVEDRCLSVDIEALGRKSQLLKPTASAESVSLSGPVASDSITATSEKPSVKTPVQGDMSGSVSIGCAVTGHDATVDISVVAEPKDIASKDIASKDIASKDIVFKDISSKDIACSTAGGPDDTTDTVKDSDDSDSNHGVKIQHIKRNKMAVIKASDGVSVSSVQSAGYAVSSDNVFSCAESGPLDIQCAFANIDRVVTSSKAIMDNGDSVFTSNERVTDNGDVITSDGIVPVRNESCTFDNKPLAGRRYSVLANVGGCLQVISLTCTCPHSSTTTEVDTFLASNDRIVNSGNDVTNIKTSEVKHEEIIKCNCKGKIEVKDESKTQLPVKNGVALVAAAAVTESNSENVKAESSVGANVLKTETELKTHSSHQCTETIAAVTEKICTCSEVKPESKANRKNVKDESKVGAEVLETETESKSQNTLKTASVVNEEISVCLEVKPESKANSENIQDKSSVEADVSKTELKNHNTVKTEHQTNSKSGVKRLHRTTVRSASTVCTSSSLVLMSPDTSSIVSSTASTRLPAASPAPVSIMPTSRQAGTAGHQLGPPAAKKSRLSIVTNTCTRSDVSSARTALPHFVMSSSTLSIGKQANHRAVCLTVPTAAVASRLPVDANARTHLCRSENGVAKGRAAGSRSNSGPAQRLVDSLLQRATDRVATAAATSTLSTGVPRGGPTVPVTAHPPVSLSLPATVAPPPTKRSRSDSADSRMSFIKTFGGAQQAREQAYLGLSALHGDMGLATGHVLGPTFMHSHFLHAGRAGILLPSAMASMASLSASQPHVLQAPCDLTKKASTPSSKHKQANGSSSRGAGGTVKVDNVRGSSNASSPVPSPSSSRNHPHCSEPSHSPQSYPDVNRNSIKLEAAGRQLCRGKEPWLSPGENGGRRSVGSVGSPSSVGSGPGSPLEAERSPNAREARRLSGTEMLLAAQRWHGLTSAAPYGVLALPHPAITAALYHGHFKVPAAATYLPLSAIAADHLPRPSSPETLPLDYSTSASSTSSSSK